MAHPISELEKSIIVDALRDWFQFFQVMEEVKKSNDGEDELEQKTLDLIESLQTKGLMEVGTVHREKGFVSWGVSPPETRERIKVALDGLGRPPSLGDVCWLANTAKGEELARELLDP